MSWTGHSFDYDLEDVIMKRLGFVALLILMSSCGPGESPDDFIMLNGDNPGLVEPSARFIFDRSHFANLEDFVVHRMTRYQCLGDVLHTFNTQGLDYSGAATAFDISEYADELLPTYRPRFIRNLSVDMTRTYYPETVASIVQTDSCSFRNQNIVPSSCADFDPDPNPTPTPPLPNVIPTPIPSPSPTPVATPITPDYVPGLSFYRVRDAWCAGQGKFRLEPDPEATKSYVGGVNIDLDRSVLGPNEDLLMNITYQAFAEGNSWPYPSSLTMDPMDATQLQVNLIGTHLGLEILLNSRQPRSWMDDSDSQMPIYMKTIATLRDPFSGLRTEQVLIPLSQNGLIDRIRIERIRGSFQLYQIDLYRLGNRGP
jgi:hypothetical protein